MAAPVDQRRVMTRPIAPQDKGARVRPLRQPLHDVIGQRLPAELEMRTGLPGFHGQRRVEQQHTLLRPIAEIATGAQRRSKIIRQFAEDVAQGSRQPATAPV